MKSYKSKKKILTDKKELQPTKPAQDLKYHICYFEWYLLNTYAGFILGQNWLSWAALKKKGILVCSPTKFVLKLGPKLYIPSTINI